MLNILSEFIPEVPEVTVDGIYGPKTEEAVRAAQGWLELPQNGVTDDKTWEEIYDQFAGIETIALRSRETFPTQPGTGNLRTRYANTSTLTQFPGRDLQTGSRDPISQEVVR